MTYEEAEKILADFREAHDLPPKNGSVFDLTFVLAALIRETQPTELD